MTLLKLILIVATTLAFLLITDSLFQAFVPAQMAQLRTWSRYAAIAVLGPYVTMAALFFGVLLMGAAYGAELITANEFDDIAAWGSRYMVFATIGWFGLAAFLERKRLQHAADRRD